MAGSLSLSSALLIGSLALWVPAEASAADPDAVSLAAEASAAYKRGDFQRAVDDYQRAYALRPEPILLFNLGRCYEALGTAPALRQAIEKYRAYLDATADAPDRQAIARRIEALERQVEALDTASRPAPPAPEARTPAAPAPASRQADASSGRIALPWIVVGVGAAGLGIGGVLGALAISRHDDAVEEPEGERANDLQNEGETYEVGSNIAFAAGSVVVLGGLVWGIADVVSRPSRDRPVSRRVRVRVAAGKVALRVDL